MHIAVVGTGYVGLASSACFAQLGHTVFGVDIDEKKVKMLQEGKSPIYEPGLEEALTEGINEERLSFTTNLAEVLPNVQIIFCAVGTPQGENHKADLSAVFAVARAVAMQMDHDLVFVAKSTVPVGTGKECEAVMREILTGRGVGHKVAVVSNPEFLREGMAMTDTLMPERIVVGINGDEWAKELIEELYKPITRVGKPLVFMNRESAEIVKYASNAFLATKISFINMLTELAEKTGGNIRDIAHGMGLDSRIGSRFLHAGIGYGGSCFPKDVQALMATAEEYGVPMPIIEATDRVNTYQRQRFIALILKTLTKPSRIAVWGLSFKPKTDDMRDAPSLDVLPALLNAGHTVIAYDPVAMERTRQLLPAITYADSPLEAVKDAEALVILTEWDAFRGMDLKEIAANMKGQEVFDGRNIYEPAEVKEVGLRYHGIGIAS